MFYTWLWRGWFRFCKPITAGFWLDRSVVESEPEPAGMSIDGLHMSHRFPWDTYSATCEECATSFRAGSFVAVEQPDGSSSKRRVVELVERAHRSPRMWLARTRWLVGVHVDVATLVIDMEYTFCPLTQSEVSSVRAVYGDDVTVYADAVTN